ncbi:flightin isoform X1 [Phthorimaea operculella]|nr:flightin isoform X1 [Phthorimaea operculella]
MDYHLQSEPTGNKKEGPGWVEGRYIGRLRARSGDVLTHHTHQSHPNDQPLHTPLLNPVRVTPYQDVGRPEPPPPEVVKGTEPKKLIFQHWVRPKFLQYNYLYRYQKNYYDDVIDYLDRRNRGLPAEKPRAQEWSERALRSYLANTQSPLAARASRDARLLRAVSTGARFHRYHTKSLIARKYSRLGFNTVSI